MKSSQKIKHLSSAGGAVYKKEGNKILWLIIQPAGSNEWRLPKGIINKNETSVKAAMREVEEEGGVKAAIREKINQVQYFYTQGGQGYLKNVTFFLMEYLEGDTKDHDRTEVAQAVFLPWEKAYKKLTYETEKDVLAQAREILNAVDHPPVD